MSEILVQLTDWHAMEILFGLAVLLVLIDYFFPVDFAAYLGYLCFAGGVFFAVPLTVGPSLLVALLVAVLLLLLHRLWFGKYLTNAHDRVADEGS